MVWFGLVRSSLVCIWFDNIHYEVLVDVNSVPQGVRTEDILHQKKKEQALINRTEVINAKKSTFPKFTRSIAKQKKQQQDIESIASLSSPVKSSKSKNLSPIRKRKKAAVDLPEREHEQKAISPVVVTETKKKQPKYKSSELYGYSKGAAMERLKHYKDIHLDIDILYMNQTPFLLAISRDIGFIHCF